ncbi:putative Na+/H+ antiporter [Chitinimonas sp. BJYL2]|uniref:putative Na+/H+ antiporter n=1 Tax=Chitinimonas sp. BJYL2 TaxID=2976696 RepID=UPI0022B2C889|nr:putative Na+/H+ antiporter [Chitinimonas sp. BJYL2]
MTLAASPTTIEIIGAVLFALAIAHTFSTSIFERLAHSKPQHAGVWHLLGEVEVVFGFWAMVLMGFMLVLLGKAEATQYIDTRNFTEPMFVFVIMVIAGTRAVLHAAKAGVALLARLIPLHANWTFYFLALSVVPLLGSFITEPAAMTLAALMLRDRFYSAGLSSRLKYATLAVLFVNISIGGTLTPYAAPPVLMVAGKWGWDLAFMFLNFGDKALLAVMINALVVTLLFARELRALPPRAETEAAGPMSWTMIGIHLAFLAGVVVFAHHPAAFMGLFLFFMGVASAYPQYQDRLILREGLLVAFFLAGLVVLGGLQQWWLQPVLMTMSADAVFYGATALTAITDNAALTYLGSLVEGLSDEFKYSLVAGAVTGGGLTVIANAPNPAGMSILRGHFDDGAVNPLWLLAAAIPPTIVAALAFRLL